MNVKKVFTEVNEILLNNKTKTVEEIYQQLLGVMSTKNEVQSTSWKVNDRVIAVYCYYHKKWEIVDLHEYGLKKGTNTGLNSMCKIGVNQWTKQQRIAKNETLELMNKVSSGELKVEELQVKRDEIETKKSSIIFNEGYKVAFDTLEECQSYVKEKLPSLIDDEPLIDFTKEDKPKTKSKKTK